MSATRRSFHVSGRAAMGLLIVVALGLTGCGYTTQTTYPTDVQTVAVPIFGNRTHYRGVEFDLTEAVKKQIEARTPYKVTGGSAGDTMLQGEIVAIRQRTLSQTVRGGLPQEVEVQIVVDLRWSSLVTGNTLRERKGLVSTGRYIPTRGVDQPFPVGQHEAVARLADQIVAIMRDDWDP